VTLAASDCPRVAGLPCDVQVAGGWGRESARTHISARRDRPHQD